MNQRQRKQFGSVGNLSIKGTGYTGCDNTPCHRLQNALQPPATTVSKGPAARRLASSASSTTATATTMLRKADSFGNIRNLEAASSSSVKATFKNSACPWRPSNFDPRAQQQLQEQYTRKLQQQIHLLELENNYLKHGTGGKIFRCDVENDSYRHNLASSPPPSPNSDTQDRRRKSSPSGTALLEDYNNEKPPARAGRKKVSYADPEVISTPSPRDANYRRPSAPTLPSTSYVTGQAELLHKLEDSYQRERKLEERLKQKTTEIERIAYENNQLSERIDELEAKLQKSEENFTKDKRALMEEAVELQRRLDYLTPALADKESHIAKLENEKDELAGQLRNATNQLSEIQNPYNVENFIKKFDQSIQMSINEKGRKDTALFNVEGIRQNEVDRLLKTIRRSENTVEELKNKEASFIDEITSLKRALREEQLTAKKDKAAAERALEENTALIKENSQLSAQLSRLEMRVKTLSQEVAATQENEMKPGEVAELRKAEKMLTAELLKMQERLQTEKDHGRHINAELEQYQKAEESARESRARMQKELDALKALSESLSNENKSLRNEKFTLNERCEELLRKGNLLADEVAKLTSDVENLKDANLDLLKKVENQENDLQTSKDRYENAERKYRSMLEQLEKQTAMQQEKAEEYENLAKRVMELSDSVKRERRPQSSGPPTRQSRLSTPQSSQSPPD